MNNLPNTKGNLKMYIHFSFFTFHMLFIYKLLYTGARSEGHNIKCSERNGRKCL